MPKKNLLSRLEKEAQKLKGETLSIANSSDPYPNVEAEKGLMRHCLEILSRSNCKIQIITKSTIVQRDMDLLSRIPSMVAVTITTLNEDDARLIEPYAPSPAARIETVEALVDKGIAVAARIDPVIPGFNDNSEELVKTLASIGVKHVTSSTYKVKPDNWRRFRAALPDVAEKLRPLYFDVGVKLEGSIFLPKQLRFDLMTRMRSLADKCHMRFGVCREGLSQLNTASCDGSWLLKNGC